MQAHIRYLCEAYTGAVAYAHERIDATDSEYHAGAEDALAAVLKRVLILSGWPPEQADNECERRRAAGLRQPEAKQQGGEF